MRISAFLPAFISRRLAGRATVHRSLDNGFWLMLDQIVRMSLALVVGVWVARYLGPEQYGWLSYATAVVGTVTAFTSLGFNSIVVRELARDQRAGAAWLGAALLLKGTGAALGFLICLAIAAAQGAGESVRRSLIVIVGLGMFFQVFDLIDLVFQAAGQARISGWIRIGAALFSNAVRALLLYSHASVMLLAASSVLELSVCAVAWVLVARAQGYRWAELVWKSAVVRRLLHESWPIGLSGVAIYAQAYSDQLIIAHYLGGEELGQYAAAMRLVVAFGFLPMVVNTVAFPEIARAKRDEEALYRRRLFDVYRLMGALFLATTAGLLLAGALAARWLLGPAYLEASALLPWLAFRLFFTNFGVARSIFIANESLFHFGLLTGIAGALVNLGLNFWWIPHFGARGAISASMVSYMVTTFALEAFHPKARANLALMGRAIFLPWRPLPPTMRS